MHGVQPTTGQRLPCLDRVGERSWRMPISGNVLTPYGNVQDGALLALANQSLALREPTARSSRAPDPFR
jgi:hypothetical protein